MPRESKCLSAPAVEKVMQKYMLGAERGAARTGDGFQN